LTEGAAFSLSTNFLSADFSSSGLLARLTNKVDGTHTEARVQFIQYSTMVVDERYGKDTSGAYLFMPAGNGTEKKLHKSTVIIVEGSLKSTVTVQTQWLKHTVVLSNSPGVDGTGIQVSMMKG